MHYGQNQGTSSHSTTHQSIFVKEKKRHWHDEKWQMWRSQHGQIVHQLGGSGHGAFEWTLSSLDGSKKAIRLCRQQGESSVTVLGQERCLEQAVPADILSGAGLAPITLCHYALCCYKTFYQPTPMYNAGSIWLLLSNLERRFINLSVTFSWIYYY